jgi:DNA-binding transcriptional MerR regulator
LSQVFPPLFAVTTYSISQLSKEFDITPRAIRFYEDQKILFPARSENGRTRIYQQRDRTRLKLTLRGKRLGLSLTEIRELIDMYESRQDEVAQLSEFLRVLTARRVQLTQQRDDIAAMLAEVTSFEELTRSKLQDAERAADRAAARSNPRNASLNPTRNSASKPTRKPTHKPNEPQAAKAAGR